MIDPTGCILLDAYMQIIIDIEIYKHETGNLSDNTSKNNTSVLLPHVVYLFIPFLRNQGTMKENTHLIRI